MLKFIFWVNIVYIGRCNLSFLLPFTINSFSVEFYYVDDSF